jgi:hypothetical protein
VVDAGYKIDEARGFLDLRKRYRVVDVSMLDLDEYSFGERRAEGRILLEQPNRFGILRIQIVKLRRDLEIVQLERKERSDDQKCGASPMAPSVQPGW